MNRVGIEDGFDSATPDRVKVVMFFVCFGLMKSFWIDTQWWLIGQVYLNIPDFFIKQILLRPLCGNKIDYSSKQYPNDFFGEIRFMFCWAKRAYAWPTTWLVGRTSGYTEVFIEAGKENDNSINVMESDNIVVWLCQFSFGLVIESVCQQVIQADDINCIATAYQTTI